MTLEDRLVNLFHRVDILIADGTTPEELAVKIIKAFEADGWKKHE